jgi:acyl phosphate:glycerol-3-phosphate acyltransferase
VNPLLLAAGAYLLGSIPTSYWVGRGFYGVDLRREGSGNLGATNAFRVLGARAAVPVLAVDVLKGWVPVALFPLVLAPGAGEAWVLVFGGAAVLGHVFSLWVGFRGGKGVATSTGVFLALAPWAFLVGLLVWLGTLALTRYVSLGSILAALVLPAAVALTPHRGGGGTLAFTVGMAAFVVFAHRANIRRLLAGTESRMGRRGGSPAPEGGG